MKYLSLFSGIEACTVAWHPLGWECVAVAEIEPFPCAVLAHHYPDVPNLGDVTKITEEDIKNLGQIDLVVFGSPCFVAGTTVISKDGLKPIESIVVGDEVLTHGNQFKPVISVGGNKDQDVYEVKASGLLPTIATAEHPYYVRETKRVWNNDKRGWDRLYGKPKWVEVKDLKENNLLAIPVLQTSENTLNLTDEECFIIGRYIADGHTAKHYRNSEGRPNDRHWQLILSVGSNKVDDLASEIKDVHYSLYAHSDGTHRAVFSSKRLVDIVEAHCGCGAENKYLSTTLLNLPADKLKRVIDGYVSGDGWLRGGVEYRVTTVSVELVRSLQLAIAKVYHVATMTNFFERPKTTVIDGRTVNQKDTYIVSFRKERPKQAKYFYEDGFIWTRFKSATKLAVKQDVFNLEVADDNSYTANNAVVHNCQNLSVAGNRKGLQGESSGLFYEAIRLISYARQHNGCRFALWENVPGAFSSNKGNDFREVVRELSANRDINTPKNGWGSTGVALGENGLVEWRVLDAQYFGLAQRRKRVFAIVDFGNWQDRPPILLEPKGVCGDTPPSRETGQKVAANTQISTVREGSFGTFVDSPVGGTAKASGGVLGGGSESLVVCHGSQDPIHSETTANCLGRNNGLENVVFFETRYDDEVVRLAKDDLSPTLTAGMGTAGSNYINLAYSIIADITPKIGNDRCPTIIGEGSGGVLGGGSESLVVVHGTQDPITSETTANCLGRNSGQENVVTYQKPVFFAEPRRARGVDIVGFFEPCPTLQAYAGTGGGNTPMVAHKVISIAGNIIGRSPQNGGNGNGFDEEVCYTLTTADRHAVAANSIIRRLTPTECEILQGFPKFYTKIPYRKKDINQCPDSPRYKALGNSMAVPVMAWIGKQIQKAVVYASHH